jgi:hypothetical protein
MTRLGIRPTQLTAWVVCFVGAAFAQLNSAAAANPPSQSSAPDGALQQFLAWFPGEYDNHEQVWQEKIDRAEHPHERLHHIFAPVEAPAVGRHVYYVQQYLDGDPARIYRQRLYDVREQEDGTLRLTIYSLPDEAKFRNAHLQPESLRNLTPDVLTTTPGCEVFWRWEPSGQALRGYMNEGACTFLSQRSGLRLRVTDDLRLTADEIWIRDEAFDEAGNRVFGHPQRIHHKNRKVRYFTGWAGVKTRGPAATKKDEEWHFSRDIVMHDEGGRWPITGTDGRPSGYSVELARVTYQETRTAVLKLGLIDDASGETLAYSWANPDAARIGINLRWAQIGLTLKSGMAQFGFTTNP